MVSAIVFVCTELFQSLKCVSGKADSSCTASSVELQWKSGEKGSIIQHQRENNILVQVKEWHKLNSSSAYICLLLFGWAQEGKQNKTNKK